MNAVSIGDYRRGLTIQLSEEQLYEWSASPVVQFPLPKKGRPVGADARLPCGRCDGPKFSDRLGHEPAKGWLLRVSDPTIRGDAQGGHT